MDITLLLEYVWILLILIGLEGILAADNAVVIAVIVKHLPREKQKKALFYGLLGAFIFRFAALFIIVTLVNIWQVQAIGSSYLIYLCINHFIGRTKEKANRPKERKGSSFWMTVLKVELADIAFALDSMLAAVALAVTLTPLGKFSVAGMDGGQFIVVFVGGVIGMILMRFAAVTFVRLLQRFPILESAAFLLVGWVGVKLAVLTLAHPRVAILDVYFPESFVWTAIFWTVFMGIIFSGYLVARKQSRAEERQFYG
ncbi:MAG TPA: hypothetical protein DEO65_02715 [Bacillus bacterium]|uniref:TerC family protein n=1 Tax=Siminovitchia fordii TaxID=254759 RepID=UPI00035E2494|nr:TerC family protein [Siminovitchia fordii]HBZ08782.1 hypothetical protein [Bacillus sp. (in: firmicutes)]